MSDGSSMLPRKAAKRTHPHHLLTVAVDLALPLRDEDEDEDVASIPTEHVRNGPHLSAGSRKTAKRTFPWDLKAEEIQLALPPPQDEDIRMTKKPRLQESLHASTDGAARKTPSSDISVGLPYPDTPPSNDTVDASTLRRSQRQTQLPPIETSEEELDYDDDDDSNADDADYVDYAAADHSDSDPVMDMYPNARTTRAPRRWTKKEDPAPTKIVSHDTMLTLPPVDVDADADPVKMLVISTRHNNCWTPDEDVELTNALRNTYKKKRGKEYKIDWVAVAALVPGRTKKQCRYRWRHYLVSKFDPPMARVGKWTADEVKKLKDAVPTQGDKNWETIAALVPGRTKVQCYDGWRVALLSNIDPSTARVGKWTADEAKKLRDAVLAHGGKNWSEIAALVPGRTRVQCLDRWTKSDVANRNRRDTLVSNIDPSTARVGKWTADEAKKLRDAVLAHGGNNWKEIAALVPGRTRVQCLDRWTKSDAPNRNRRDTLDSNVDTTTARVGRWTADEDKMLKDAVCDKNWETIAALVPCRTKKQCWNRWRLLGHGIAPTARRSDKFTADEDKMLRDAVAHGGNNWKVIAALVPGRLKKQCWNRWRALGPSIALTAGRTDKWTADEDKK
jgi:hypothetical protein